MLQQTLIYYISGSTAILQGEENELIFRDVSLNISGSEYETDVPGGFSSTIGTIRIDLYSGSILIASFPYDQTNLIINSSSNAFVPIPPTNVVFGYPITYDGEYNDSYFFNLKESSSLDLIAQAPLINGTRSHATSLYSSSKYIAELYSGNNKYNQVSLYDVTNSLVLTSSWITGSGSVVLELTGSSIYNLNVVVSGSTCCSPTLNSIEGLGYERLKFTYTTGSCGTFNSMSIYQSADQINWNFLTSGSSSTIIISDSGSYPSSTTYYRLIQHCSGGYNSDPSNVLFFTPSTIPSIPNFYYVSIVGRANLPDALSSITRTIYYSPDSGSTQIDLGSFTYTTTYQPIISFYIYSGSTLIINPSLGRTYGIGYNASFTGYCGTFASASSNYGAVVSSSIVIYVNIGSGCS